MTLRSRYPGDRSGRKDHPYTATEDCDECHEYPDKRGLYDYGTGFICHDCLMRHVDEAEARLEGDR